MTGYICIDTYINGHTGLKPTDGKTGEAALPDKPYTYSKLPWRNATPAGMPHEKGTTAWRATAVNADGTDRPAKTPTPLLTHVRATDIQVMPARPAENRRRRT